MATLLAAAAHGWALSLTLIVAIGAQNAFVLRQGLRREHVGAIVLLCAATDALLMGAGVAGMARLMQAAPRMTQALAIGGVAFLTLYALRAWRAALASQRLLPGAQPPLPLAAALAQAAAFTYLNPHVYLDTVLLVGSVGGQQASGALRLAFWLGAATASGMWFALLGYGARALAPWLARVWVWRALDAVIGAVMLAIAWQLLPLAWPRA